MKGLSPLILGILGTFAFSWIGLTMIPNAQIGHLDPQVDEDGNDPYPAPKSGMAERGRLVYAENGCFYCHSQQVRADYAAADIERKWGERRSAPRDYLFERPVLLGKSRMGPDLANVGGRAPAEDAAAAAAGTRCRSRPPPAPHPLPHAAPAPAPAAAGAAPAPAAAPSVPPTVATTAAASGASAASVPVAPATSAAGTTAPAPVAAAPGAETAATAGSPSPAATPGEPAAYTTAWHHQHLYAPRSIAPDSIMPAYRFLFEKRRIGGELSANALRLTGKAAPARRLGNRPDLRCAMSRRLSHVARSIPSFERSEIDRRGRRSRRA